MNTFALFEPKIGVLVNVVSRTWPGINKPGGVGRITDINYKEEVMCVDVEYILGGSDKSVELEYVKKHVFEQEEGRSSRRSRGRNPKTSSSGSANSSANKKGEGTLTSELVDETICTSAEISKSKSTKGKKSCTKRKKALKDGHSKANEKRRGKKEEKANRTAATITAASKSKSKKRLSASSNSGSDRLDKIKRQKKVHTREGNAKISKTALDDKTQPTRSDGAKQEPKKKSKSKLHVKSTSQRASESNKKKGKGTSPNEEKSSLSSERPMDKDKKEGVFISSKDDQKKKAQDSGNTVGKKCSQQLLANLKKPNSKVSSSRERWKRAKEMKDRFFRGIKGSKSSESVAVMVDERKPASVTASTAALIPPSPPIEISTNDSTQSNNCTSQRVSQDHTNSTKTSSGFLKNVYDGMSTKATNFVEDVIGGNSRSEPSSPESTGSLELKIENE